LDESSARQIWVGWGSALVCLALALIIGYYLGEIFIPFMLLFMGAIVALRGHNPSWFIRHVDAQIILGTPSRREESWRSWILALAICVLLAFSCSQIYKKVVPEKPDIATTILKGVQALLTNQPPATGSTGRYSTRTNSELINDGFSLVRRIKGVITKGEQRRLQIEKFRQAAKNVSAEQKRGLEGTLRVYTGDSYLKEGEDFQNLCLKDTLDIRAELLNRLGPGWEDLKITSILSRSLHFDKPEVIDLALWTILQDLTNLSSSLPSNPGSVAKPSTYTSTPTPPTKLTPERAFSVTVEARLDSPSTAQDGNDGIKNFFTGMWIGYPASSGYAITPATFVAFVRIVNVQSHKTTLSRVNWLNKGDCKDVGHLDTLTRDVFFTVTQGSGIPATGRTINFPANGTGGYLVMFDEQRADLKHAAKLDLPLLDKLLSDHYMDPGEAVRGWVLFHSPCLLPIDLMEVTDIAGNKFTYDVSPSNIVQSGDVLLRTITVSQLVDLSNAIKK